MYTKISNLSLQTKILLLIGSTAVIIPAILIALLASVYYYLGIEKLFSEQVSSSIQETVQVAKAYLDEHINSIKIDALSIVNELDRDLLRLIRNEKNLNGFLDHEAEIMGLSDIMIFTIVPFSEDKAIVPFSEGKVIAHTSLCFSMLFETLPPEAIEIADKGEIYIHKSTNDKVQAVYKLNKMPFTYLIVGRYIDSKISQHLQKTEFSANIYLELQKQITTIRSRVIVAFLWLSAALLVVAALIAHKLARIIIKPINDLAAATSVIKSGNFTVRVPENRGADEIGILAKAFNQMTARIAEQHQELTQANAIIDERVQFIEAVLSELSAGVLALDKNGFINLYNHSTRQILHLKDANVDIMGLHYTTIFPEIQDALERLLSDVAICEPHSEQDVWHSEQDHHTKNLEIQRNYKNIYLLTKIAILRSNDGALQNIIVAFDDITELNAVQRLKAWTDVARRVAHEIKNPLTPIQLSVERLKKKFLPQILQDADAFSRYIDTITSRVDDIQVMVSEFLAFARISLPQLRKHELRAMVKETLFLQQSAHPNVEYKFDSVLEAYYVNCDRMQIMQVFTNLLKNAAESILSKINASHHKFYTGIIQIVVYTTSNNEYAIVEIHDNGAGIDPSIMDKIYEPYITTKASGTGLGLSIVKKIIEEHQGKFSIQNKEDGACASFTLKLASAITS
ncbi:two-component system, NtrC family, nitrogen regulation sensor histidine kinase NtrY [Alphaproteobacteria bacterium]